MYKLEQLLEDSLAFEQNNQQHRKELPSIPTSGVPRMASSNLAEDLGSGKKFGAHIVKD